MQKASLAKRGTAQLYGKRCAGAGYSILVGVCKSCLGNVCFLEQWFLIGSKMGRIGFGSSQLRMTKYVLKNRQCLFSNEADGLLRELQTQRLFSDVLLLKLFCGDFHWGVVALSPVEGGVEEECLAVSEKLTMLLAQQLLPMLEKLSPRDTALNLLRKDALILLAEEIKTPLTVARRSAQNC